MDVDFPLFARELEEHSAPGYHRRNGAVLPAQAQAAFTRLGILPPAGYVRFLERFGPGRYFAGSLELFDIAGGPRSVEACEPDLAEEVRERIFAIGYDGTTEGCFCLDRRAAHERVLWYRWGQGSFVEEARDFSSWIESRPAKLYRPKIYRGYRPPKSPERIAAVIEQRAAIDVRLIRFDRELVRPPSRPDAFLPRYNALVLGITKCRPVEIGVLTVEVLREGSRHGPRNVDYLRIDIAQIPVGVETELTCHSFDPYNVPFESIAVRHVPTIDLATPMRTHFHEILEFL